MTHKNKSCETSLATHVETCEKAFTYTPLQVPLGYWEKATETKGPVGIRAIEAEKKAAAEIEIAAAMREATRDIPSIDALRKEMLAQLPKTGARGAKEPMAERLEQSIDVAAEQTHADLMSDANAKIIEKFQPDAATASLPAMVTKRATEYLAEPAPADIGLAVLPFNQFVEMPELGIFFTESLCMREEGTTTGPGGFTYSVVPGEVVEDSWSFEETLTGNESTTSTEENTVTTTDRNTTTQSFSRSLDEQIKRTTDLKYASSASFSGKLFKVIDAKLSGSGSFNFSNMLTKINKSSSSEKREFVNELVRKLHTTTTISSNSAFKEVQKSSWTRRLANTDDCPHHFIERDIYNVYSIHHKRMNAHLGYSGCMDDPSDGLCTPDNLADEFSGDVQAIRDKWILAGVPASFGTRPADKIHKSGLHYYSQASGNAKDITVSATIPAPYFYCGSPVVNIVYNNTNIQQQVILSQPAYGATGGVSFLVRIDMKDKIFNREKSTFEVCFKICSTEAAAWDAQVAAWRDEQAQTEIDAFLQAKQDSLGDFYKSNRFRNHLERRILQDVFGVDDIQDCCKYLGRLKRVFNFEDMCFTLLPTWNANDDGCDQAQDVNASTAKCLQYYVPVFEDREAEALALLRSVGAIPWSPQIAGQAWAYINEINQMRATEFASTFDPSTWATQIDQPLGYQLTSHQTTGGDWDTVYESSLNFTLLNAFVVAVPNGGRRTDVRGHLCDDHCAKCDCDGE